MRTLSKTFPIRYWQFSFSPLDGGEECSIIDDVIYLKVKSPRSARVSRRVQWRAPVIQVTGRLRLADRLSSGVLSCSGLCRSGVRTKFGIDMALLGEPGTTRSSKEGWTGPGRKRSRSKPPCRSVVGSRLWIDTAVQLEQYSETQSFMPPFGGVIYVGLLGFENP